MVAALVPNAQRIAQIIRSNEQDLALMTQQRRLADAAVCASGAFALAPGGIAAGTVVDSKVAQLAERVSVLMAGVQQRCEADKQDVERRLEDLDARADARARTLEARLAACERAGVDGGPASLREVRAVVDAGLLDASEKWSAQLAGLRGELRSELGGRLDELAERARLQASRFEQVEVAIGGHEQSLERTAGLLRDHEEHLQGLQVGLEDERVAGYDQLEGAVANLERCFDELRVASEVEQQRLRLDMEALRHRSADSLLGLRNDLAHMVEARLESELAHLGAELRSARQQAAPAAAPPERRRSDDDVGAGALARELGRRLEDTEARLSALRVRVDGQDGRLAGMGDRAEAAGQQAQDMARQVSMQQREDILSETDCQLRIVRQRVDTLSELCEELLLRQGPEGCAGRGRRAVEEDELASLYRRTARPSSQPLR